MKRPELLSPAGNFEKLKAAVLYGANAVYLAGNDFGMRAAADNFSVDEIGEAVKYAHERGVKVYLTVNTMPRPDEYPRLTEYLDNLSGSAIDAVIAADLGVIALVRERLPDVAVHVSTQASIVSAAVCKQYYRLGCTRAVLARELPLEDIKTIIREVPDDFEIETFVHGSMCVSYSGQCLLSEYFLGRDANRGKCAQPCRWEFEITQIDRRNDKMTVMETEHGTFVMSSRDMRMAEHMGDLIEAGISSFKIEGRMKSAYYAAVTANCYRMAIDAYLDGKPFNPDLLAELDSVSHREYCSGFFYGRPGVCSEPGYMREKAYLATAVDSRRFIQRNKLSVGDKAELISPNKIGRPFTITAMYDVAGNPIESMPHPQTEFLMDVPFEVKAGDIVRGGT
jgi:Collagenase and related proteases